MPVEVEVTGRLANTAINADDFGEVFAGWLSYIHREGHEQIERLLLPLIPQFGVPDGSSLANEGRMLVIAMVGDADASVQGSHTDPTVALKGVIALIGVLDRRGTVLGRLVQSLKALLGDRGASMFDILLEFRP